MIKRLLLSLIVQSSFIVLGLFYPGLAFAQSDSSIEDIESLITKEEEAKTEAPTSISTEPKPLPDVKNVSDLGKLEPFGDIAVIQRRFLPKTGRFEAFAGGTIILNDAFFQNFGLNGRFAFYFSENLGIELLATSLTFAERQVTTDLRQKRGVVTRSFVTPQSYYGVDFKWTPVYGKMTWLNSKITPFDLYFSFGGGMTGTNQGSSEPTLHLGTGQTFARTKGIAYRWDFSWNAFNAKSSVDPSGSSALYHNIMLTLGMSFFFPEATYR